MNGNHPRSPVLDRRQPDVIDEVGRGFFATFPAFIACMAFPPLALLLYPIPVVVQAFIWWSDSTVSIVAPLPVAMAAVQLPLVRGLKAWFNPSVRWRWQLIGLKVVIVILSMFATLYFTTVETAAVQALSAAITMKGKPNAAATD